MCGLPVELRLAGSGNNATSGRVEVRYKGVWGTICDDNFGEEEGAVVCRMLGFGDGVRAVVHSEAAFGAGRGPIWVQNVACSGSERSLEQCRAPAWQPTYQCKHLEDVGVECVPYRPQATVPIIDDGLVKSEYRHHRKLVSNLTKNNNNTTFINRLHPIASPISGVRRDVQVQCGQSLVEETPAVPVARIAGGLQSRPGAHPWAASIRLQGTAKSFHWCGAVLLSEFHVLTVAHCMEDYPKDVYRVRVGDWDMQVVDVEEQDYRVEAVHFHDEYNVGLYLNNDIAVVRIVAVEDPATSRLRGIRFGERVVPACLPPMNAVYGDHLNCTVAGWGSTGITKPGYTRYLQVRKEAVSTQSFLLYVVH